MRVLIIGGTRFIGPRVVAQLAAAGHDVTVAHRGEHTARLPPGTREFTHPRLGAPIVDIPDDLLRVEPEVVVHMMAMGEADALAAVHAFAGVARRIVAPSSGDVYRAYAVFTGLEAGALEETPLREDSPLRESRYPYRTTDTSPDAVAYWYDKVLAEAALRSDPTLPATILRLPKVYGPEDNANLETVYAFRHAGQWKWTHGFVDNVAHAISLAVTDDRASGRVYNVGEEHTPTLSERLAVLPRSSTVPPSTASYRFEQNVEYDTSLIRRELGYVELVDEERAMLSVLQGAPAVNPSGE